VSDALRYALVDAALLARLDAIAADVGRLRRGGYIVERLVENIHTLDTMLHASAGELVHDGVAVDEALATVDRRDAHLRRLLGEATR
jgi:hypothetical protein